MFLISEKEWYWCRIWSYKVHCVWQREVDFSRVVNIEILYWYWPAICHSDWLFHGESCPRIDVVHPGRAWSSSHAYTWHCCLHYLFLRAIPLFPQCDHIMLASLFWQCLTVPSLLQLWHWQHCQYFCQYCRRMAIRFLNRYWCW